ncbi:hypothetical protein [Nocardioides mangrovi]|uniref:STAS domain-containing protein n=1 Tax=Nocardioides mangrovi TaxID=2874580 RepID=A0ABS7UE85_9ACTN|nr:hypothetical protein [Nocardioides mangrovi]MBZ5739169.1 hypothetical protein [Nocardioides mangrovi]
MCTISYERRLRRLRIAGPCVEGDRAAVQHAISTSAAGEDTLTIDLTAATALGRSVAAAIVAARDARAGGRRITVLRRHRSDVDRQLAAAERDAAAGTDVTG